MLTPWRVRLLGDLRAERGTEVVARFRSHATASLFAFLALHPGRSFGREELADKFWPDAEPEAARNSLRVSLSALKKALEPPPTAPGAVIETTRTHLKLRAEAVQTDVAAFESAVRGRRFDDARKLYGGPLLPGFYDDWALDEGSRLEALAESLPTTAPWPPGLGELGGGTEGQGAVFGGEVVILPHNLPLSLTPFFGREEELGRLLHLLADDSARLVTLLGPGGVGKTRTALEAARTLKDGKFGARAQLAGGLWFVPAAALADAARLPDALRDALGLTGDPGGDPLDQIAERLDGRPALAIFDNLEQLGGAAGPTVERILSRVPRLCVLATSRIRLGVPGERTLALSALAVPGEEEPLESLAVRPAVALFADRARAASPEFGLTPRNAASVARLCSRLDGLPLALELAAAWAGAFTPAQMCERLTERLALEARRPDREKRHLSLRAAISWSVELLSPELRRVFANLSVFPGAFSPEAAGEVTETESVHDALTRLREQSLLVADTSGDAVRFTFLESLREFARELLDASPDADAVRTRHAAWAVREADALRLTLADEGSVRAALEYLAATGRRGDAMKLTGRYAFVWFRASLLREGEQALNAALALDGDDLSYADRLPVYRIRGAYRFYYQDLEGSRRASEECRALAEANGDEGTMATMQMDRATAFFIARRFEDAQTGLEEVLPRLKDLGRTSDIDACLQNIGICAIERGQLDVARQSLTEALEVSRGNRSPGIEFRVGLDLNMLARLERREGDIDRAMTLQKEAETVLRADENQFYLRFILLDHAVVLAILGQFDTAREKLDDCRALQKKAGSPEGWLDLAETLVVVRSLSGVATPADARTLGASQALREARSLPRFSQEEADYRSAAALVRDALGKPAFDRETKKGARLTLERLVATLPEICGNAAPPKASDTKV